MALVLYGTQDVQFTFQNSSETVQETSVSLSPPSGTQQVLIYLQGFNCAYANDEQYGFGQLAVSVQADGGNLALCKAALRDNNLNKRVWGGQVSAMVMFFGPS